MEDKDIYILLIAFTVAALLVFFVIRQNNASRISGSPGTLPNYPGVSPIPGVNPLPFPTPIPGVSPIPGVNPLPFPTPIPGVIPDIMPLPPSPGVIPTPLPPTPGVIPTPLPPPLPMLKCGTSNTKAAYLINATPVYPGKYPWVVAFLRTPSAAPPSVCTGTLISPTWILSAAHCQFPNSMPATIGGVNIAIKEPQTQLKQVIQVINHPQFSFQSWKGDICLMKLDSPVTINNYVHPICLPPANFDLAGKPLIAAGYGSITANPIQSSSLLREGVFNEVSTCRTQIFNKTDRICLQSQKAQICVGDSGGPLMCNINGLYSIVGVCSTGEGPKCYPPFIHTRVSAYLPWIKQYVKDL